MVAIVLKLACYNICMERAWDKILLACDAVAGVLLLGMMFFTSPSGVGPLGILIFLLASYVLFLGLAVFCCRLFFRFRAYLNKAHEGGIEKKSYYYGAAVAIAPILLMVCSSLGGINLIEIGLVLVVEFILCFLIAHDIL
jgi:hypothetical protein